MELDLVNTGVMGGATLAVGGIWRAYNSLVLKLITTITDNTIALAELRAVIDERNKR